MQDSHMLSADIATTKVPHVLTVAGSDSGAGAGIQADLKACAARGVYCSTVITAVTAQNTRGVQGVHLVPEEFVEKQLRSVLSDMQVGVVKTGMLPSAAMVIALRNALREFPVKALVVDPVMVSTSGDTLSGPETLASFRDTLLPMADILTPNVREASILLNGVPIQTITDMRTAAKLLHAMGPRNVLVKGGDLPDSEDAVDVFFDGESFHELRLPRVNTRNTHGTGCTLASCIAAEIAKGSCFLRAASDAKRYVESVLEYSKDLTIGEGSQRPFDHFEKLGSQRPFDHFEKLGSQPRFRPDDLFLYAVTDSGMNKKWKRSMVDAVAAAIEGGATMIQLREKECETREMVETAAACRRICKEKGVPFVVNDRVDVALACDADGVHLGQSDMDARVARTLLGPDKIIGVSCKTEEQAARAYHDGADYIGCGGVYPTSTKENNTTVGLEGLRRVCATSRLPVVAIGGINASNAADVFSIGVAALGGVAVVSALFNADDVREHTANLRHLLLKATSSST